MQVSFFHCLALCVVIYSHARGMKQHMILSVNFQSSINLMKVCKSLYMYSIANLPCQMAPMVKPRRSTPHGPKVKLPR